MRRFATRVLDRFNRRSQLIGVASYTRDFRSVGSQFGGHGLSQALRSSRDNGDLSRKVDRQASGRLIRHFADYLVLVSRHSFRDSIVALHRHAFTYRLSVDALHKSAQDSPGADLIKQVDAFVEHLAHRVFPTHRLDELLHEQCSNHFRFAVSPSIDVRDHGNPGSRDRRGRRERR